MVGLDLGWFHTVSIVPYNYYSFFRIDSVFLMKVGKTDKGGNPPAMEKCTNTTNSPQQIVTLLTEKR